MFYDSLLAASVVFAASGVAVAINGDAVAAGETWFQLYLILVLAAYFVGFWKMAGYTPGMRPWRIKIVTHDGARLSWAAASLRFGYCWLSAIPVLLGYLWAFWARDRLMWHDRLSGTKIIRDASLYKQSTN